MNERTTALSITCLSRGHEMKEEQIWDPSPPLPASACPPVLTQVWDKQQHTHLPNLATGEGVPSQLRGLESTGFSSLSVSPHPQPATLPKPSAQLARAVGSSPCVFPPGKGLHRHGFGPAEPVASPLPSPQHGPPAWASRHLWALGSSGYLARLTGDGFPQLLVGSP